MRRITLLVCFVFILLAAGVSFAGVRGGGTAIPNTGVNKVTKSDGTTLVDSVIYDTGTNVGIGTTVPQSKLDVAGDIYGQSGIFSGNLTVEQTIYTGGSPRLASTSAIQIDNGLYIKAGNIGIGTWNSNALLDVGGGTRNAINSGVDGLLVKGNIETDGTLYVDNVIYAGGIVSTALPHILSVRSSGAGTSPFVITKSDGKIKIFDVQEDSGGGGQMLLRSSTGSASISFRASGADGYFNTGYNVGIGTAAPRRKLHVYGATRSGHIFIDGGIYLQSADGTYTYCEGTNAHTMLCGDAGF